VWALLARNHYTSSTLYDRLGERYSGILDGINPESIQLGPQLERGPKPGIPFAESHEGGENEDGICWKMMLLEFIKIQEGSEEIGSRL
jgi:hypothetical protein